MEAANDAQKHVLGAKVKAQFGVRLSGLHFALWGLASKANTGMTYVRPLTVRSSRSTSYRRYRICRSGCHVISYIGPDEPHLGYAENQMAALENADALVIVTEWKEFRSPDFDAVKARLKTPLIFDGRNLYDPALVRSQGFEYFPIGR